MSGKEEKKSKVFISFRLNKTEKTIMLLILVLFIILSITTDQFLSLYNITNIFKQASVIGIIAIGALVVIISAGIDLSVGSITGLSAMVVALLMKNVGLPISLSIIIAMLFGTLAGLYNGVVIYGAKLPPFIATLGSMTMIRGAIKLMSDGKMVPQLPDAFKNFGQGDTFGVPNIVYVWAAVIIVTTIILTRTQFGRNVYVIGSSQEVAKLSGINMKLNIYAIYTLTGFLCSLAGILLSSRLGSAVPTGGTGYEMSGIAATVIGGASLSGAQGTVLGTVLGTILMTLITNGGVHLGINPFIMEILTGVIITIAVALDMSKKYKK
jgi:ribose transport system permease protein